MQFLVLRPATVWESPSAKPLGPTLGAPAATTEAGVTNIEIWHQRIGRIPPVTDMIRLLVYTINDQRLTEFNETVL